MMPPEWAKKDVTELMGSRAAGHSSMHLWLLTLPLACASAPLVAPRDLADANDTGRTLAAQNANERELLRVVGTMPDGAAQHVGNVSVIAEAPYTAASGHTCRALHIQASPATAERHRLACAEGESWFFVPDVFGADDRPSAE